MVAEAESREKVEAVLSARLADLEIGAPLSVDSWQALFKDFDWKNMKLGEFGTHLKVLLLKVRR